MGNVNKHCPQTDKPPFGSTVNVILLKDILQSSNSRWPGYRKAYKNIRYTFQNMQNDNNNLHQMINFTRRSYTVWTDACQKFADGYD